jgi:hypothetical protein
MNSCIWFRDGVQACLALQEYEYSQLLANDERIAWPAHLNTKIHGRNGNAVSSMDRIQGFRCKLNLGLQHMICRWKIFILTAADVFGLFWKKCGRFRLGCRSFRCSSSISSFELSRRTSGCEGGQNSWIEISEPLVRHILILNKGETSHDLEHSC